jgi:predicted DNA-binding protein (UPF0251 family)
MGTLQRCTVRGSVAVFSANKRMKGVDVAGINQSTKKRAFRVVAVNDAGHVVGESHPNAKLTDHDVDLIFELREEGLSLGRIAKAMEVHKNTVQKILDGTRRGHVVSTWRRVPVRG